MKITLTETPGWPSPYGKDGALVPLPARMRFLAPDALAALTPLAGGLVFTDVFRSPAASMEARARKAGAAKPGYSAHNFGLAVDLDVRRSIRGAVGDGGKAGLDAFMERAGWLCYRKDHALDESESWHFSFGAKDHGSRGVEAVIQSRYGAAFVLTPTQAQEALKALRLYAGAIDGDFGRQSRAALDVFKRGWKLPADGKLDAAAQRLLAVVTAEVGQ